MILDGLYQFDANPTSVAIAAGTQASTNAIDLHGAGLIPVLANLAGARDMGIGDNPALKISCIVVVAFASAASAGTLSVTFQGAPDNGSGAPGTYVSWYASPVYTTAQCAVGAYLLPMDFPRPPANTTIPRFVRLLYTVAVATMTAGSVAAHIVLDRQDAPQYPAGLTISN